MRLGAVLLAAGFGKRFGGGKLTQSIAGKPMVAYAMDAMKQTMAERMAVVTREETIAGLAQDRGIEVVRNETPELGISHSIVLGACAMREMDALLLLVGDQPLLTCASLRRLLEEFEQQGASLACLQDESHWGNPAVFGRNYIPELLELKGDKGAKEILKRHKELLTRVPCLLPNELMDADTPQELELAARLLRERGIAG